MKVFLALIAVLAMSLPLLAADGMLSSVVERQPDQAFPYPESCNPQPDFVHVANGGVCYHFNMPILEVAERKWLHNIPTHGIVAGDPGLAVLLEAPESLVDHYGELVGPPSGSVGICPRYAKHWTVMNVLGWQEYIAATSGAKEESPLFLVQVVQQAPATLSWVWPMPPVEQTPFSEGNDAISPIASRRVVVLLHWDGTGDIDAKEMAARIENKHALQATAVLRTFGNGSGKLIPSGPEPIPEQYVPSHGRQPTMAPPLEQGSEPQAVIRLGPNVRVEK